MVTQNLKNAFPQNTEKELLMIRRKFYQYFCDFIIETLKTLTITERELRKRILFEDISLFQHYFQKDQSVIVVLGHMGNWEWGGARFALEPVHPLYVLYHPLKNPHFEKLVLKMRTRLGYHLYPMQQAYREMVSAKDQTTATAFIADQTPSNKNAIWLNFLNQKTLVFAGTEKIAKKLDYPVIYVSVRRKKRGLYGIHSELLFENPGETAENEISIAHTQRLERDIQAQPEIWLWSHRRWKHQP